MTKVVFTTIKVAKNTSVKKKLVRRSDGRFVTFHTLNAESPTFVDDLTYVFKKNVARARKAKRKQTG